METAEFYRRRELELQTCTGTYYELAVCPGLPLKAEEHVGERWKPASPPSGCAIWGVWLKGSKLWFSWFLCCHPSRPGGSRYSCRRNNIHGAAGPSGTPVFTGGRATRAAGCVSVCTSHVMAPAPQCGIHRDPCPLVCLLSSSPPAGSPSLF